MVTWNATALFESKRGGDGITNTATNVTAIGTKKVSAEATKDVTSQPARHDRGAAAAAARGATSTITAHRT